MLSFYIAAPQVENDRLSQRTRSAMRQAQKEGRYLGKAPIGYTNDRVNKLITVNKEKAEVVKFCYEAYAKGNYTCEEVRRMAKEKGLTLTKQGFIDLLRNPFYTGKIKIKAWGDEPERESIGLHQPIISESLFFDVQRILKGKKKPYKGYTKHDILHLSNNLICEECGMVMNGSRSKGNGGNYDYYHCQKKGGCGHRFRADLANESFNEYLKTFEPNTEVIELYNTMLEHKFRENAIETEKEKKALEKEIELTEQKMKAIDDKYFDSLSSPYRMTDEEYRNAKDRFANIKSDLVMRHATLVRMPTEYSKYMKYGVTLISNLSEYYSLSDLKAKKIILGSIFPEKLKFSKKNYRTTKLNDAFRLIVNTTKDLRKKQAGENSGLSTMALPSGLEPETL